LSGVFVDKLKRRSKDFFKEASRVENPDLAMFFLEQAVQLYIKAVIYELFGISIRGHNIRELLGFLLNKLLLEGYEREAEVLSEYIARNRSELIVLEEAYFIARYGSTSYEKELVSRIKTIAEELLNLLEEISRSVKLG